MDPVTEVTKSAVQLIELECTGHFRCPVCDGVVRAMVIPDVEEEVVGDTRFRRHRVPKHHVPNEFKWCSHSGEEVHVVLRD